MSLLCYYYVCCIWCEVIFSPNSNIRGCQSRHWMSFFKLSYSQRSPMLFAGHISVTDRNRLDKFFRKFHRRGLVNQVFNISSLIDRFDSQLFRSIAYPDHCLHYLLPEKRHYSMLLRPRGHSYTLNHISTTHFKNTFVNRCIFGTV